MSDEQIYFNNKTHDRLSELEAKDVLNLQEMKYFMSDVNELKGKYKALLNGMEIQSKEIAELRASSASHTELETWKTKVFKLDEQLNELKDVGSARQTEIELESGVKIIQIIEIYDNGHENTFDDVEGYFKRVRDATRKDSGGEKEKKGSTLYGVPLKDYPILQPRETDSKPPEPKCPICDGTGINTHIEKDEIGLNKFAHYPCQCRNEPREDDVEWIEGTTGAKEVYKPKPGEHFILRDDGTPNNPILRALFFVGDFECICDWQFRYKREYFEIVKREDLQFLYEWFGDDDVWDEDADHRGTLTRIKEAYGIE